MKRVKTGKQLESALIVALDDTIWATNRMLRELGFTGLAELQTLTPRRTSFAASMWRVGYTPKGSTPIAHTGLDNYAVPPPSIAQFHQFTVGSKVILYNNAAYIGELNQGTSDQARQGIIEPAYAKLTVIANRESRKLSREKSDV